ncbi:hypothetical protein IFT75_19610 [Pseudomonas sp. CFBP 8758]|uniref:hypothetical protein n=1 Tax=Pseudomonas sp. CFBP 8758 TaxID=2775286 RepID=UPI001786E7A2|nr:hypothetical protein [Pseudomonas sp. CFBP 8758]MBD8595629.1 hypothetical protein [Pseudomonas sp. CFBP 8758]
MIEVPWVQIGINATYRVALSGRNRKKGVEDGLSREIEAMPANQAEVVGEYMAVKLVAELSA